MLPGRKADAFVSDVRNRTLRDLLVRCTQKDEDRAAPCLLDCTLPGAMAVVVYCVSKDLDDEKEARRRRNHR